MYEWIIDNACQECCTSFRKCSHVIHVYLHWTRRRSSYPVFLRIGSLPAECWVSCPDRAGIVLKSIPPWWTWGSEVSLNVNRTPEGDGVSLGTCYIFVPAYDFRLHFWTLRFHIVLIPKSFHAFCSTLSVHSSTLSREHSFRCLNIFI